MKLVDLFERDEGPVGYGERRKELISKVYQTTVDKTKLRDPNYLMTITKSYLSLEPYSFYDEKTRRKLLRDVMDAFGIAPPDHNTIRFMTR